MAQLSDKATDLTDLKDVLLRTDETFRQLVTEHHQLDERIRQLSSFPLLTTQQQYEETSLKKLKLALKDRIEAMLRGHQDSTRH
jgi:uncharacterized protein YdcH (DUF465 family)